MVASPRTRGQGRNPPVPDIFQSVNLRKKHKEVRPVLFAWITKALEKEAGSHESLAEGGAQSRKRRPGVPNPRPRSSMASGESQNLAALRRRNNPPRPPNASGDDMGGREGRAELKIQVRKEGPRRALPAVYRPI